MDWSLVFSQNNGILLPLWGILIKLFGAILIGVIGFFLSKGMGKAAKHIIQSIELKKQFKKAGIRFNPETMAENVVKYLGYLGTFIVALNYLGITPVILNIIFVGILIVVILTLFLSLKDFVPNVISGIHLISINKLKKGDQIKIGDVSGKVSEISLTETTLLDNGNKIIIPNSTVMKEQITIKAKSKKK
ncbi:mechanosensitive ion channel [Candidatus Woesearchaeota archaeon]|jgi:small conductance mechanosensitive channel|nr:mechanosensitive ion channel [Candidatus Woesearchaeota archaeon]MBT7062577.1 mechanosensitive ion channel [Candidatus Woesearchaeota archaeon]MBT7402370.1 mechanosensitive ion channel [Candidatus Woesearchaeota archaeon]